MDNKTLFALRPFRQKKFQDEEFNLRTKVFVSHNENKDIIKKR